MVGSKQVTALIVAGGSSSRMGFDKLLAPVEGTTVIEKSVQAFATHPLIDEIVVVAGKNKPILEKLLAGTPKLKAVVQGGAQRSDSVKNGLAEVSTPLCAIHDAARPYVSSKVIRLALEGALSSGCAAPAVPVKNTIKQAEGGYVRATLPRDSLFEVQTPQVVDTALYRQALTQLGRTPVTDDCMVMENAGCSVLLTQGDYRNLKITTPEDLPMPEKQIRVGHGYDVHRLVDGRPLILGGVRVPFEQGLLGHSDADVLTHAVMDAMLGAVSMGDIGMHFPDTNPEWEGADSLLLLQKVRQLLRAEGWCVENIDATLLCQRPKLASYIPSMRAALADSAGLSVQQVSVKATTEEGLGFTGAGEGIAAHAVVLITRLSGTTDKNREDVLHG